MNANYTPGPWSVFGADTIIGPSGNVVAECCGYSNKAEDAAQRAQGGRESNAVLIAAAPTMLEALALAEATIERLNRHDSANGTLDVIRAAIASATGEPVTA
jgi:hypothetical protein